MGNVMVETMAHIKIALINRSTLVKDSVVAAFIGPLQEQVAQHFAPIWGTTAELGFVPAGTRVPATCWQLVIVDDAEQAVALGYQDISPEGLPVMKIFAHAAEMDGVSWTRVASHEVLESLADPWVGRTVFAERSDGSGRLWPLEVCDPVEGDLYTIDGAEVSNFVTPHWFLADAPLHATFDYMGLLKTPFEVRPTGYMEYFEVASGSTWQMINPGRYTEVSK